MLVKFRGNSILTGNLNSGKIVVFAHVNDIQFLKFITQFPIFVFFPNRVILSVIVPISQCTFNRVSPVKRSWSMYVQVAGRYFSTLEILKTSLFSDINRDRNSQLPTVLIWEFYSCFLFLISSFVNLVSSSFYHMLSVSS